VDVTQRRSELEFKAQLTEAPEPPVIARMDEISKQALLEAVNLLITHPSAHSYFESLLAVTNLAKLHPIELTGEAAPLNALLRLRLKDEVAYERVLELVETKRHLAGYDPLIRPTEIKFDKTEYMRSFMDKKRERQRRAVEIENMLRPERDALKGRARLDFMDRQSAKWKQELDTKIERARQAQGGRLMKEALDTLREQFWTHVDSQLDQLEALAREEMRKPLHARSKPDASLDQLQSVLAHDPYKK
jgi:hypothetical protein